MSTASAASSNTIGSTFLAELEHEAKAAREVLSRVPADKFDWKPHEKSMSFGKLASHVAEMIGWTGPTLQYPELDFSKMDYKPFEPATSEELLEYFDKNLAEAADVLRSTNDEQFMESWTMRNGETVYFTLPKAAVMRSFVMNHIVHHRGQLSVYLRLNDIPVPSIYGPSADEGQM
ncbi:MAG TPA: DinB family protein [Pyrinomonadaceae bacterium]|nr:DinB family protein [Pyrinomonadaceae bacterium]